MALYILENELQDLETANMFDDTEGWFEHRQPATPPQRQRRFKRWERYSLSIGICCLALAQTMPLLFPTFHITEALLWLGATVGIMSVAIPKLLKM